MDYKTHKNKDDHMQTDFLESYQLEYKETSANTATENKMTDRRSGFFVLAELNRSWLIITRFDTADSSFRESDGRHGSMAPNLIIDWLMSSTHLYIYIYIFVTQILFAIVMLNSEDISGYYREFYNHPLQVNCVFLLYF